VDNKVFEHVKQYCVSKGWGDTEADVIEAIREGEQVWEGNKSSHRWWDVYTFVVEIKGMFIGFRNAVSTGDMSASENGYEFSSDSICEYEAKEITTTVYAPKKS
jgi:hypothetical protein